MSFGSAVASGISALWVIGEGKRSSAGLRWRGSTWWSPLPLFTAFHTFKVRWVFDSSAASPPQPRGINGALVLCRIKHEYFLERILINPVWLCHTVEFHLYTHFSEGSGRPRLIGGLNPHGWSQKFTASLDTPRKSQVSAALLKEAAFILDQWAACWLTGQTGMQQTTVSVEFAFLKPQLWFSLNSNQEN